MRHFFRRKLKQPVIRPKWEEIFSSLGDGLVILNSNKIVTAINPAAESIIGYSAEEVLGHSLEEAFVGNEKILSQLQPLFEEVRISTLREVPWEGHWRKKATVDLTLTPLVSDNPDHEGLDGWILVYRDMTPIKNLEEEVRKADRLAMMGTIAAGLAHEIKNPLSGIKGSAQLLAREQVSQTTKEYLNIIIKETDRVDRLISNLLDFTKPKTLDLKAVNLNELLDSILVLQKKAGEEKQVEFFREFDPSLPDILGDTHELTQVFLNFIKNSVESLTNGHGEIRIRSRVMTDFKIKKSDNKKASRIVMAEIQDNGQGMDAQLLDKIFTPFFTTKEKGTGLGMAIAQRIVKEHGGTIRVRSQKDQGTSVQVFLRCALP